MSDTVTSTEAVAAPEYPMERSGRCPFAPPPEVMELAAAAPLSRVRIWDGSRPWLITGYEEARALFADSRVSVDDRKPGFPHWNEHMLATVDKRPRSVFTADAEEHTFYRRMLSKPFTFKRVEALRPAIQKITDGAIDKILAGPKPAELVTALALPVPTEVICEMLGVPYEDHGFPGSTPTSGWPVMPSRGQHEGRDELGQVPVQPRRDKDGESSRGCGVGYRGRVTAGRSGVKEAAQLASGLLIAGHETTANMIGIGVLALLENPEQLAFLRDTDDPKAVANAVEELLRYLSIIQNGQRRVATEDIEIGGQTIKAGEGIIIDLSPANWDAAAFPDPERLDLRRPDADKNLAFGYGRHQCVGQQLARAELQIVFATLLRRIPTLALAAPLEVIPFRTTNSPTASTNYPSRGETRFNPSPIGVSTMSAPTLYPPGGLGAPKDRHTHADDDNGLPAGTGSSPPTTTSRCRKTSSTRSSPELKEKAPRIWYEDGAYMVGRARARPSCRSTSAGCSCSTTTWPARLPPTSRPASPNCTTTVSTGNWPSPTPFWRCSTTRIWNCASGCSASTTSISPRCRSAATVTSTASG